MTFRQTFTFVVGDVAPITVDVRHLSRADRKGMSFEFTLSSADGHQLWSVSRKRGRVRLPPLPVGNYRLAVDLHLSDGRMLGSTHLVRVVPPIAPSMAVKSVTGMYPR